MIYVKTNIKSYYNNNIIQSRMQVPIIYKLVVFFKTDIIKKKYILTTEKRFYTKQLNVDLLKVLGRGQLTPREKPLIQFVHRTDPCLFLFRSICYQENRFSPLIFLGSRNRLSVADGFCNSPETISFLPRKTYLSRFSSLMFPALLDFFR